MKNEILRMEGVRSEVRGVTMLRDLHLTLYRGETMGLVLHNPFRRDCIAALLRGQLPVEAGRIYYGDRLVDNETFPQLCQRRIAYIGGQSDLIDELSVAENIFLMRPAAKTYLIRRGVLKRQAAMLLSAFQTQVDPSTPVSELSTLQRLTVELVKAVACGARIVLLNELSRTLSPAELEALMECVARLKSEGMGILMADAYWDVLSAYTDRVTVYSEGRMVKLLRREEYSAGILPRLLSEPAQAMALEGPADTPEVLSFAGVFTHSLRDVSLCLHRGEVVSILDMDGSGAGQIAALLAGERRLLGGGIRLDGQPYQRRGARQALEAGLGFILENPTRSTLMPELSVMDNLALPISGRVSGFFLHRRFQRSLRERAAAFLPPEMLEEKDLSRLEEEQLLQLVYARWRLFRPKAMVLMRPLSVTDAHLSQVVQREVTALAREGSGVLILSANASEARRLGHRVLALEHGRLRNE